MNLLEGLFASITPAIASRVIQTLVWGIKNNGIEKTLEDIQSCDLGGNSDNQKSYDAMFSLIRKANENFNNHNKSEDGELL
jgi:hypothetical protein